MRRDEDVLDIFRLGCRELYTHELSACWGTHLRESEREKAAAHTLILVPPFTDFSKELAMGRVLVLVLLEGWSCVSSGVSWAVGSAQLGSGSRSRSLSGHGGSLAVRRMRYQWEAPRSSEERRKGWA
jgi:hypothetical protein